MAKLAQLLRSHRETVKLFLNKSVLGSNRQVFSITKVYKKPCGCEANASLRSVQLSEDKSEEWIEDPSRVFSLNHLSVILISSMSFSIFHLLLRFQHPSLLTAASVHMFVCLFVCTHRFVCWFCSVCSSDPGSFFYWQSSHHGYMLCRDLLGSTYHVLSGWYTPSAEDTA